MFSKFIFDEMSSDIHDILCVKFGSSTGEQIVSAGSETDLSVEKAKRNNKFYIVNQSYSNPMSLTFQIVNTDGSSITPEKESTLEKWLCKRGVYKWFQLEDDRYANVCYEANISNPKLIDVGDVKGMEFTLTTNSAFGYSPILTKKYTITDLNKSIGFYINTDENDYIYPTVIITMVQAGILEITNSTEVANRKFTLNNVKVGEIISIDNELPDISSSTSHDVYKDFNKHWLRFIDGKNSLIFNLNCTVIIQYREIRKVGVY